MLKAQADEGFAARSRREDDVSLKLSPRLAEMLPRKLAGRMRLKMQAHGRAFTSQTGKSPLGHFYRIKMERARRLLAKRDTTVKEIAFALGYRHFNDFSRACRQHFGHPPTRER